MIADRLQEMAKVVRRIIGVPDYERYLAHERACHPDRTPLTRDEFSRDSLTRRYETPGNRCC
jgi:uncharacterized short protein YbdD (DUF466 family)